MEALAITIEPASGIENTHIVHFNGDFDGGSKEYVGELENFIDSTTPKSTLIFDFSKLNFLNSYAIGSLVAWHTHLSSKGGAILIAGTNKNVEDIFAIVGISNLFKIFPDLTSALNSVKKS